jgi:cystathionine gamma-synthase
MHSASKYLNGHSDVIAGALATKKDDELWQRIRYVRGGGGAVLGPFEAWLLLRGMRTLHLRVAAACANAMKIALRFERHAKLSHVLYPGLPSHPGHAVALKQMSGGFGGMISLRLKAGEQASKDFTARARSSGDFTGLWSRSPSADVEAPAPVSADLVRLSIDQHADDWSPISRRLGRLRGDRRR